MIIDGKKISVLNLKKEKKKSKDREKEPKG